MTRDYRGGTASDIYVLDCLACGHVYYGPEVTPPTTVPPVTVRELTGVMQRWAEKAFDSDYELWQEIVGYKEALEREAA